MWMGGEDDALNATNTSTATTRFFLSTSPAPAAAAPNRTADDVPSIHYTSAASEYFK